MSFWEKIKSSLRRFMVGRNGPDELSFAILIFALVLLLVSSFFASWVLNLLWTGVVCVDYLPHFLAQY